MSANVYDIIYDTIYDTGKYLENPSWNWSRPVYKASGNDLPNYQTDVNCPCMELDELTL